MVHVGLMVILGFSLAWAKPLELIYEERPPYLVKEGENFTGLVVSPLIKALENARIAYVFKEKPSKRHLHEVKNSSIPLCAVGWFKNPERETYARYTKPLYQDRPTGILARKNNTAVTSIKTIEQLVKQTELTMLSKKSYSYGPFVDKLVAEHGIEKREVGVDNAKMLSLLAKQRADYMFISYEEAHELLKTHPQKDKLVFIGLEGMPEGNHRYLVCSKATDEAMILRINEQLP